MQQGAGAGTAEAVEPQLIRLIKARLSKRWVCEKIKRSPYAGLATLGSFGSAYGGEMNDSWFRMYLRYRADRKRVMILTYTPGDPVVRHQGVTLTKAFPFAAAIKMKKKKKFYFNLKRIQAVEFNEFIRLEETADLELKDCVVKISLTPTQKEAP